MLALLKQDITLPGFTNTFKLFGFPSFRLWAYLMKAILQKRVVRTKFDIFVFINSVDSYIVVLTY